jgi:hypothetical protein
MFLKLIFHGGQLVALSFPSSLPCGIVGTFLQMIRAKAIAEIMAVVDGDIVVQNMQEHGCTNHRPLYDVCFTLTSAMGLGGGQTPMVVREL